MIRVLDQHTIDKIAAGEVVERPASVVKELVENAIDSGANAITVEIKNGGIDLIRVTDNGCGIRSAEVPLAFTRHATSKIREIEDLLSIASLGFRGEALSSIASVSQVELITKTGDSLTGIRYEIADGKEVCSEEIACPDGTTFLVRNLFYHTPARRKFLKTPMTEAGYITDLVEQIALSHPDISFKYVINGSNKLFTTGNGNLKEVIYQIYGKDIVGNLIPISSKEEGMAIEGFIAKPYISRGNRNYEHYYVNGRYIKSPVVTKAIEEAYKTFVMIHKFPFVVLNLSLDSEKLDVNIHPRKMEMRYTEGDQLYSFVFANVRGGLMKKELMVDMDTDSQLKSRKERLESKVSIPAPEPFETKRRERESKQVVRETATYEPIFREAFPFGGNVFVRESAVYGLQNTSVKPNEKPEVVKKSPEITEVKPEVEPEALEEADTPSIRKGQMDFFETGLLSKENEKKYHLIGQLFKTYWLIEHENTFFMMDQHAAHEKVNYERFLKQYEDRSIVSQQLMPPLVIHLNSKQLILVREQQDLFEDLGFQMEVFGDEEIILRAVPLETYGYMAEDIFVELADSMLDYHQSITPDFMIWKIATMSCKAAIKGNQEVSAKEAEALMEEMMELDNPYNCPHGRPTLIAMTKTEIEKKFKRIQDK